MTKTKTNATASASSSTMGSSTNTKKKKETKEEVEENDNWKAPAGNPFGTAIVFSSYKDPRGCACAVSLRKLVGLLQQQQHNHQHHHHQHSASSCCPKCGEPIAYVQDGMVGKKEQLHPRKSDRTVLFKYGRLVYELTVPRPGSEEEEKEETIATPKSTGSGSPGGDNDDGGNRGDSSSHGGLLAWLGLGGWSPTVSAASAAGASTLSLSSPPAVELPPWSTAQGRVSRALGLNSMKILCKGKVIFPAPSSSKDGPEADPDAATASAKQKAQEALSEKIMNLSKASGGKVVLLVMGTLKGQELKELKAGSHPSAREQSTSTASSWLGFAFQLGQNLVLTTLSIVQSFLKSIYSSFIQPLLLAGTAGASSNSSS